MQLLGAGEVGFGELLSNLELGVDTATLVVKLGAFGVASNQVGIGGERVVPETVFREHTRAPQPARVIVGGRNLGQVSFDFTPLPGIRCLLRCADRALTSM